MNGWIERETEETRGFCLSREVWNNGDDTGSRGRGCISHVPRKVPFTLGLLGPTELHYRLISSALNTPARHSIAILGSDYRILSADIPKTMQQRDALEADKTAFSPAATKMKKNPKL